MKTMWLVGVDEAGRGPLAGPVAVGAVKIPVETSRSNLEEPISRFDLEEDTYDWSLIPGVGDSKKIAAEKREALFRRAQSLRHHRQLDFAVAMVGSSVIDERGIMYAINLAVVRCIKRLELDPNTCHIRLDGSLQAPSQFSQETIIKGDAKEKVIGLASILAKVTRDKYMTRIACRYTQYGFAQHMGYGTEAHREAIARYGKCPIHRVSYCKNIKTL
ncbi:MAG: ribonuclease HII [Candidatus Pacebacteria bacterium]|nr:ribonuclease HII [Candidatus Paceibacterota bacterium]